MERMEINLSIMTKDQLKKFIVELEEENRNLKSDLAFERTMLDNVKAEYKSLQNVNKKLKEENEQLKEKLRILEEGGITTVGLCGLMEEDTLQELRDIGEI